MTRNRFSEAGEAVLARLEALTLDLARKAARLPSRGELIDNDPADLARYSYWAEPALLITEAYLDERDAHLELPEQQEVIGWLKARFVETMVAHVAAPGPEYERDDYYDDETGDDAFDLDEDALDDGDEEGASRTQPLEEEPLEEEP